MKKDLIIIGGGPGGYVAAIRAAQLGAKVALIEKNKLGGTCLNRGCIPTKALYKNAQVVNTLKHTSDFGVKIDGYSLDMMGVQARKQEIVDRLVSGINQLVKANDIELISGEGTLVDRETVTVREMDNVRTVKGENILIATGSVPGKPPIPGLDLPGVMTSDDLLDLDKIPESMVIIGGGVVGIELAGIFHAFGTKVTVMEFLPSILPSTDGEIVKRLTLALKKMGIKVETGIKVKEICKNNQGLTVLAEGKKGETSLNTDVVLVSTGRSINVDGLNLESVGIEYDRTGIMVNDKYETNIPGIYAIGDVIGGKMLAHVASDEGIAAVDNIIGHPSHINYDAIPSCVFSFPEVATVGLTEEETKEKGIKYLVSKFMFGANGKALTMGEGEGLIKVIACEETKKILGVHIMGPHASDLIHEATLAINSKLKASDIVSTVHAHPTLAETFLEAVSGIENRAIHAVPRKRND